MNEETRKFADNVFAFLDKASRDYGRMQAERFNQDMWMQMQGATKSPIEDLFFIACHNLCESAYTKVNPEPTSPDSYMKADVSDKDFPACVFIRTQAPIGKFKVDFLLKQNRLGPDDVYSPVIVELDGHEFHDKDKRQRAYEKSRDRFLVKTGYRVLHYTGSEVVTDPYKAAHEALGMIGVFDGSGEEYDAKNPLGIE